MRRFQMFVVLAMVAVVGGPIAVRAQNVRIEQKRAIVVPQEVLVEIQRLIHEAIGEDAMRDIGHEIERAMRDVGQSVGRFNAGPGVNAGDFQNRDFRAEATDKETKTLAIGANGSLELKNVVGDITVKAGGSREATVEIVRVSHGRTDADAKLGLEKVKAEVTSRGSRGSVVVEYPEERRPAYSVSVAFNVTAPAGTAIVVNTITGNVTLTGIKGETSINTTTGGVDITQAADLTHAHTVTGKLAVRDSQGDAMDLGTMNGTVTLSNVKAKRLELSSVTGPIAAHDVQAGGAEASCMSCSIEYSGPVVSGGRYEFTAHNGEIRLGLAGGFDFEGQSFSGQIDADPSLGLKPGIDRGARVGLVGMRRQSVKGEVGGGGAIVEATTFSGNVKIGRKLPEASPRGRTGGSRKR